MCQQVSNFILFEIQNGGVTVGNATRRVCEEVYNGQHNNF